MDVRSAESQSPSKAFVMVVMLNITVGLGILAAVVANSLFPAMPTPIQISVQEQAPAEPFMVQPASLIGTRM
jgi:hypothetical protein